MDVVFKTKYRLSDRLMDMYDYKKTKTNLELFFEDLEEYKYTCIELLPPRITPNYEVKYEMFTNNKVDKVGDYVEKKIKLLDKVSDIYDKLSRILNHFSDFEKEIYLNIFEYKLSEFETSNKLLISERTIRIYKRSVILKLAIGLDIAVKR